MTTISSDQEQSERPMLGVNDLQVLLQIVDLAAQRGAFRGPELSQIGIVFDKVNRFVAAATPAVEQPAEVNEVSPPPFTPKVGE
jgi:hypothetical protein